MLYLRLFLLGALVRGGDQSFLGRVVGRVFDVSRVVSQRPDDDRGEQDHGSHLLQVLRAFVPHMPYDVVCGRDAVRRKLHDERSFLLGEQQFLEQNGREYGDQDADQIDREQHESLIMRKKGRNQQYVHGQTRAARHERNDQHGHHAVLPAFERPRGHNGRDVAAESHQQRDERLAVQADLVHQLIHDEGGARHVARVLHQRNEEKEDQYVRQKDDDAPHSADDPSYEQFAQGTLGHKAGHPIAEPLHARFHPFGRYASQRERGLESDPHQQQKNGQSPDPVRHHAVDSVGRDVLLLGISGAIGFLEGAGDKSVLGIRDDCFGGFSVAVFELFAEPGGRGVYFVGIGGPRGDDLADILVVAQQSDRQIARRVTCHQILVFPYLGLQGPDALLYVGAVVDMDMTHDGLVVLEYVDDRLEQGVDPFFPVGDGRDNGYADHAAQIAVIQRISRAFQLVVHVQRDDHFQVHVDQLSGQQQVALEVRCVDDVDYHVGHFVQQMGAHV